MTSPATPPKPRKELIVFPRGTLNVKMSNLLRANGYLAIEVDDPKAIVRVIPMPPLTVNLSGDEIVRALITTAFANDTRHKEFGAAILGILKRKDGTP